MKKAYFWVIGAMVLSMLFCGFAVSEEMQTEKQITISGTVNASNQLIDENGQAFNLADTEEGMKVKAMIGQRVQIKGTLLEEKGSSLVRISEYTILQPPAAPVLEE